MDIDKYTYQTFWSEEDGEYVGTVLEFPSLSWLDPVRDGAEKGIISLVKEIVLDMKANGEKIPVPLGTQSYSGKFQVRTSRSVHKRLVMEAARDGVSLNAFINQKLSAV
ncbi:type II toxin-antitoxin system HicB family antitoxin [Corynebacterium oculi]|uniref:type II toxin-antitoxin system HicB family antitoxin n=1 Tax=Corynebacterium oculi TaxID=1544416 RepID=UPI0009EBF5D1|nr:type II toxin-antitoxin system HicB family antitoxin [Corynebacterium oculi]